MFSLRQGPPNCELFTISANKRTRANIANNEQCERFTLSEQCEQRTVHFSKIVEQGEQVRALFGGALSKR